MKIVLINPPSNCVNDDRVEPPLGLLYIASNLKNNGFPDITLLDMTGCQDKNEIESKISDIPQADIFGISCYCTNYLYAKQIIQRIKNNYPNSRIILGGPQPTSMPEEILADSGADYVAVGEGEDIFSYLAENIKNQVQLERIITSKGRNNIDSYPFPDRSIVDLSTYSRSLLGEQVVSLLSSRGCTNKCIHCNSIIMGGGSTNVRYRSTENLLAEINTLLPKHRYFRFNDDNFTGNPNLERLLIAMEDLNVKFRILAKLEHLTKNICKLLSKAGCVHITVGLESLNEENLRILGKANQIGKEENIKFAKDQGLTIRSSFMVGLPFDSDSTIEKYFKKAAKLGLDEFAIYPLIPYPGTQVWKNPGRFGYEIVDKDFTKYIQMGKNEQSIYALKHKNFQTQDVKRWKDVAQDILMNNNIKHMKESSIAT